MLAHQEGEDYTVRLQDGRVGHLWVPRQGQPGTQPAGLNPTAAEWSLQFHPGTAAAAPQPARRGGGAAGSASTADGLTGRVTQDPGVLLLNGLISQLQQDKQAVGVHLSKIRRELSDIENELRADSCQSFGDSCPIKIEEGTFVPGNARTRWVLRQRRDTLEMEALRLKEKEALLGELFSWVNKWGVPGANAGGGVLGAPVSSGNAQRGKKMCEDCGAVQSTWGVPGQLKKKRWCAACGKRHLGAQCTHNMCEDCNQSQAKWGLPGGTGRKTRWCYACAKEHPGAHLAYPPCEDCGATNASWAVPGDAKPRWCARCGRNHVGAQSLSTTDHGCKRRRG